MKTLIDIARDRAQRRGDSSAFVFLNAELAEICTLSFSELDNAARRVAAQLQACGAKAGDRAVLYFSEGPEFVLGLFGCFYSGAIAVPCFPPHGRLQESSQRLRRIVEETRARFVLCEEQSLSEVAACMARLPDGMHVQSVVVRLQDECLDTWRDPGVSGNEPALLQFTSGSVSAPKGVIITHANVLANQALIQECFGNSESSVAVSWLPRYHDMGLMGHVLQPLYFGGRSVLMAPMTFLSRPVAWLKAISRYAGTASGGPNFGYQLCIDRIREEELQGLDLRSWEVAYVGAEPIRARTLSAFREKFSTCGFGERALYPCYGLAESTLFVVGSRKQAGFRVLEVAREELATGRVDTEGEATAGRRNAASATAWRTQSVVSVGVIGPEQDVAIVDEHTRAARPDGEIGEIWVRHASVSPGYWGGEQQSQEIFSAQIAGHDVGGYLRTGDLGFILDRNLFVTGRCKDLIIVRGRNYSPVDIEIAAQSGDTRLQRDAGAAFPVTTEHGEQLVLVQELTRTGMRSQSLEELLHAVGMSLAESHGLQPYDVVLIRTNTLPKTSSGKIRRRHTRELYERGELTVVCSLRTCQRVDAALPEAAVDAVYGQKALLPAASAQIEREVTEIVRSVLGLPKAARDASLFALGADSITAAQVVARVQSVCGVSIELQEIFRNPTIAAISARVHATRQLQSAMAPQGVAARIPGRRTVEI